MAYEYLITFIVIVIILVILIYVLAGIASQTPILDCFFYGYANFIGDADGPVCKPGDSDYGGVCYTDTWTANGGSKTAVCTVSYPDISPFLITKCGIGIYNLDYGQPCDLIPDWPYGKGYFKTAVCTCQGGGTVTGSYYCQNQGFPDVCPAGTDYYESACYSSACPAGTTRTGICGCTAN
jgi:hypothetical protein